MTVHNRWRPPVAKGIPRSEALRRRKLAAINADLRRLMATESLAEPAARIARQEARDRGFGQLV